NSTGALGADVTKNNVEPNPLDPADWQHMVTFTVGLADGFMTWQPKYDTAPTGDFHAITSGATGCFFSGTGICNWPVPAQDTPSALDDLWHAAVNSHGTYFHASDPLSLAEGLGGALGKLTPLPGAGAGGAVSTPSFTATDNFLFTTGYTTADWTGTLHESTVTLDEKTGNPVVTVKWKAEEVVDAMTPAQRTIRTFDPAAPGKLKAFQYDALTSVEKQWVDNVCVAPAKLSQCANLVSTDRDTLNRGKTIVDFIRGSKEGAGKLVRARTHLLGDIVGSSPVFVRAPPFQFADAVVPSYAD